MSIYPTLYSLFSPTLKFELTTINAGICVECKVTPVCCDTVNLDADWYHRSTEHTLLRALYFTTGELGRTSAVNRVVRPRGVLQKCGKFSSTDLWSIIYSTEIITSLCGYGFRGLNDVFGQHYCVIGVLAERSVHNLNYFVGIKYFGNISASYHHFSIRCEMISHFKNEVYLL